MGITILAETTENYLCFERFKQGDEKALAYIHKHTSRLLEYHGRQIIDDNFVVNSLVQEVYIKAWDMRDKMESMYHLYCFMKMNLSWTCLGWLKNARNAFYRKKIYYTNDIETQESYQLYALEEMDALSRFFDEERMEMIEKVIPYLPPDRQTMFDLHFKQGLSYKAIARRFGTSHMAVHSEVRKGLEQLKKMIHRQKKTAVFSTKMTVATPSPAAAAMDLEMAQIFRLRLEYKMGFATIAEKMKLEQAYVQRKYVEAHALVYKMGMAV
jgi:RNA polymerase sigma factor (sigma-70 family)